MLDPIAAAPPILLGGFFLLVGLVVGSFLNVVILRLPAGESVVRPRSRCPSCRTPITAWDNIPVLSWLILGGRCRSCRWPIPIRYPIVEALAGLLYLLVFWRVRDLLPAQPELFLLAGLHGAIFVSLLLAISVIDLDHMIIPDLLSLPGAMAGVLLAFLAGAGTGVGWQDAALGAVTGAGFLLAVAVLYELVRKREGMGMGDVKLMATLGAFLGLEAIPFIIFGAALQGTLAAGVWLLLRPRGGEGAEAGGETEAGAGAETETETGAETGTGGETETEAGPRVPIGQTSIPFGPFLALAAFEWYVLSDVLGLSRLLGL